MLNPNARIDSKALDRAPFWIVWVRFEDAPGAVQLAAATGALMLGGKLQDTLRRNQL